MIAAVFPSLVNYLPNKIHLTSETAPPPTNPLLQECLESSLFADYDTNKITILGGIDRIKTVNTVYLPDNYRSALDESYAKAGKSFALIKRVRENANRLQEYIPGYRPLHVQVRVIQKQIKRVTGEIEALDEERQRLTFSEVESISGIDTILADIKSLELVRADLEKQIPPNWQEARDRFHALVSNEKKSRQKYRFNADESYESVESMLTMINELESFKSLQHKLPPIREVIENDSPENAMIAIKALGAEFDQLTNASPVKSKLSKAHRALRGNSPNPEKAVEQLMIAIERLDAEIIWRDRATRELQPELKVYDQVIQQTIGMRLQQRLRPDQAEYIASCLAVHKDLTLFF